jgi:DNA-binding protein YbaB
MGTYDQLHAYVRELESHLEHVEETVTTARQRQTHVPIADNLGTVIVTGTGQLTSVDLDPRKLTTTNGAALGRQVADAIRQAESSATIEAQQRIQATRNDIPDL